MEYRFVVLDLDGTVLTEQEELTPRVRQAIKRVQELGIEVTFATGRRWSRTLPWVLALGLTTPIIVHNGALVIDPITKEILLEHRLSVSLAKEILEELKKVGVPHYLYLGPLGDELMIEEILWKKSRGMILHYTGETVTPRANLVFDEAPFRICVVGENVIMQHLVPKWEKHFQDHAQILVFPRATHTGVEFLPKNCTKATGVEFLLTLRDLSFDQVVAIGDDINDEELLLKAKFGVAMQNAPQRIREIANFVTARNTEDGVALVLEDLFAV